MRFDRALHDTVEEMVAELRPLPPGFAAAATARGRRIRRRRRLAAASGVLAAVAAILLPFALLRGPDRPDQAPATTRSSAAPSPGPTASPEPTPTAGTGSAALPGRWRVMGAGKGALKASGAWVQLPSELRVALVAPAGHRVLTQAQPDDPVLISDVGGDDQVSVDTHDLIGSTYNWSPTGDRLVSGYLEKDSGDMGFAIVDARTGKVTKHPVDHVRYDCSQCDYAFTRDGREVVVALADRSGGEAADLVSGLQFFNAATGAATRAVPAKVWVPASPYAFSPDGRYLVAEGHRTPGEYQRIDLTTNESKPFPYAAVWVDDEALLAPDNLNVVALTKDGAKLFERTVDVPDAGVPIVLGPPD